MDQLLNLQTRHLTKSVGVNGLHLNHWSLLLVDVAEIHQMVIEVKVKRVTEPILNPQILALFLIKISSTLLMNLRHLVTIVNHQMRHVTTSQIGCTLRLLDGWSRTTEWNQPADPKVVRTEGWCHSAHIISNSPAFLIKGFLRWIMDWHISKD